MNINLVVRSLFKEVLHFPGKEVVKAETQDKVIQLDQIKLMKSAPFFFPLSVRSAAKRPHHGVGRLQGHLFSFSETSFSIVGLCFVAFLPRVLPFFARTSAWRSAQTKVLPLKREANPCQEQGWVGREKDKEDTFVTHLVCPLPVPSPLSLRHVSGMWHPEELECTSYFQYCSPQGSRNHKPSSSKLQAWVKSHETAVKITFQGSFCLPSVFRDLRLRPACFRIPLQQKKFEKCTMI